MDRSDEHPQLGKYRVVGSLGDGALGRVLLGEDPTGRRVSITVVRAELAAEPGFRERFREEVRAAAAAPPWFVAAVLDADPEGERPWLVTAFVDGPTLRMYVDEYGPLGDAGVSALAVRTADGLVALHDAGLVHRDLSPTTLILADDGPRLVSLGIARIADAGATVRTGLPIASPEYLSPEQAGGAWPVGPASDMFSFGALLGYAATGRSPFAAHTPAQALVRVIEAAPDLGAMQGPVRDAVAACLAKDPAQRPTAGQVAGMFRSLEAAASAPTLVAPPGPQVVVAGRGTAALPADEVLPDAASAAPAPGSAVLGQAPFDTPGDAGIPRLSPRGAASMAPGVASTVFDVTLADPARPASPVSGGPGSFGSLPPDVASGLVGGTLADPARPASPVSGGPGSFGSPPPGVASTVFDVTLADPAWPASPVSGDPVPWGPPGSGEGPAGEQPVRDPGGGEESAGPSPAGEPTWGPITLSPTEPVWGALGESARDARGDGSARSSGDPAGGPATPSPGEPVPRQPPGESTGGPARGAESAGRSSPGGLPWGPRGEESADPSPPGSPAWGPSAEGTEALPPGDGRDARGVGSAWPPPPGQQAWEQPPGEAPGESAPWEPKPARSRAVPIVAIVLVGLLLGAGLAFVIFRGVASGTSAAGSTPSAAPSSAGPDSPADASSGSATTGPAAGTVAVDPSTLGVAGPHFTSPSRNITCLMSQTDGGSVRCDVTARTWQVPPQPSSCPFVWGEGAQLDGSAPGALTCASDTVTDPSVTVLDYGQSVTEGSVVCVSRDTGVRCTNLTTGHGFRVSRATYELF